MTSLDEPNGVSVSEPQQASNDRWDFFRTLMEDVLRAGDILVRFCCHPHAAC